MPKDEVRDAILIGVLIVEACDEKDVHELFLLLKKEEDRNNELSLGDMSELEWELVVKKTNSKSTSSIFSKRKYSIYNCALESTKITNFVVIFYIGLIKKVIT